MHRLQRPFDYYSSPFPQPPVLRPDAVVLQDGLQSPHAVLQRQQVRARRRRGRRHRHRRVRRRHGDGAVRPKRLYVRGARRFRFLVASKRERPETRCAVAARFFVSASRSARVEKSSADTLICFGHVSLIFSPFFSWLCPRAAAPPGRTASRTPSARVAASTRATPGETGAARGNFFVFFFVQVRAPGADPSHRRLVERRGVAPRVQERTRTVHWTRAFTGRCARRVARRRRLDARATGTLSDGPAVPPDTR